MLKPHEFSIGGWCLVSGGSDPFGGRTRNLTLADGLEGCARAGIPYVSFHDGDLWDDDASSATIDKVLKETLALVERFDLKVYNFTTNLFSNRCFRSGALSSPFPQVRQAAIVKACRSMDLAARMGAQSIIFWGGREGSDGAYEQDTGTGLRRYMEGIRMCVDYALEKGYDFTFTVEPKVYEPRLLGLFAGTGASASSAIRAFFPEEKYAGRVRVNPEYPQHVSMVGLDPVIELGQLLEEDMLAPFVHFGGQIPGRMDCDLPPGVGSSLAADFMICYTLHSRGWQGVVEFDCRPIRTTTSAAGVNLFLKHSVQYWRMLEGKVERFDSDPIMQKILAALNQPESAELAAVQAALTSGQGMVDAVARMTAAFTSFEDAGAVDTDVIEAHLYRLIQILTGTEKEGAAIFENTPWRA